MKTEKTILGLVLAGVLAAIPLAVWSADAEPQVLAFTSAMELALAEVKGTPLQQDLEVERRTLVYNIEIMDASGYQWEVEVDALFGDILSSKREDRLYSYQQYKNVPIEWSAAVKTALGEVEGSVYSEFELERNWDTMTYEVKVIDGKGRVHTVNVNGNTGEVASTAGQRLRGQVKISLAEAKDAAVQAVGSGTVAKAKLEWDNALYYELVVVDGDLSAREVKVDASSGKVLDKRAGWDTDDDDDWDD